MGVGTNLFGWLAGILQLGLIIWGLGNGPVPLHPVVAVIGIVTMIAIIGLLVEGNED